MKTYKIFVGQKDKYNESLEEEINNFGIRGVRVKESTVYWFTGVSYKDVNDLANKVLHNPLIEEHFIDKIPRSKLIGAKKIEIVSNVGVIDPREASVKKAAADLRISKEIKVKFGRLYTIFGKINLRDLEVVKNRLLMKPVIEHEVATGDDPFVYAPKYRFKIIQVPLTVMSDKNLAETSEKSGWSFTLKEMKEIQRYYKDIGREPTDIEVETIAQTWSEHCSHKTFKGSVTHNGMRISNLLETYITRPSEKLKKKYVVSDFSDNAGGIEIGEKVVCVKVETHNHPSAIEPVGGAETGIGGVIRDILGFGKGAKPISSVVCFGVGPQNFNYQKLPKGVLHPKAILSGIVSGTKSYGNQMGIPTDFFQDSIVVHENYLGNPLVYAGTVGVTDLQSAQKSKPKRGDLVLLVGGLTGRDGIHGATFSSIELKEKSEKISGGAVQIGDAIMEKKTLDATLEMKETKLIRTITDCGGGGLSSAVGETGENLGVKVNLEKVPKKYEGLNYTEIWISESQERMIVVLDPKDKERAQRICKKHGVPATVIGEFTGKGRLEILYERKKVADLDMKFLHHGCPVVERSSVWKKSDKKKSKSLRLNLSETLLKLLQDPDIRSKSQFSHQYDSTVQGRTILRPAIGEKEDVHSEVSVRQISPHSKYGVALALSLNPRLTELNPRRMTHWVVAQSLAKLAACGADVAKAAMLDNYSWGSPNKPEVLGELVESLFGCREAIEGFRIPFISGKDSLYNEFKNNRNDITIPGTLLLTAIAPVKDVRKVIQQEFQLSSNPIYLVGSFNGRMGGSYFNKVVRDESYDPPEINFRQSLEIFKQFNSLVGSRILKSSVAVSKGGLLVGLSKMSLASGFGVNIDLNLVGGGTKLSNERILFSESGVQLILEVEKKNEFKLKKTFGKNQIYKIGTVGGDSLKVSNKRKLIDINLLELQKKYNKKFS